MSLTCFFQEFGRILDGFTSDVFLETSQEIHQSYILTPGVAGSQIAETHFKVEAREGHKWTRLGSWYGINHWALLGWSSYIDNMFQLITSITSVWTNWQVFSQAGPLCRRIFYSFIGVSLPNFRKFGTFCISSWMWWRISWSRKMFVHGVWGRNHGKLLNLAPSAIAIHKKQVDSQSSKHKMIGVSFGWRGKQKWCWHWYCKASQHILKVQVDASLDSKKSILRSTQPKTHRLHSSHFPIFFSHEVSLFEDHQKYIYPNINQLEINRSALIILWFWF